MISKKIANKWWDVLQNLANEMEKFIPNNQLESIIKNIDHIQRKIEALEVEKGKNINGNCKYCHRNIKTSIKVNTCNDCLTGWGS